ncbi:HTH domain-containing protein [Mycolicibacterium sp.]|uniref:HTH domain-containing protein n=1 Tax=Mycolicibacterium sp. TaxID=2320850 RepID=UPI0037C90DAC
MQWKQAIAKVLRDSGEPMHYADIAQAIIDLGYRKNVGATPAATVSANLSESMRAGSKSQFVKVNRGVYALRGMDRTSRPAPQEQSDEAVETSREMGLINAFGMFWSRNQVAWQTKMPRLLGVQQTGSTPVNFTGQAGVYVLYDIHRPIYVGRVTEPRMGLRLFDHTRDRLTSRWDRFSWFGVRAVTGEGTLTPVPTAEIAINTLIATMEALLIEGLEPPQNRRQGDGFNAVEFIQTVDPEVEKKQKRTLLEQMSKNM